MGFSEKGSSKRSDEMLRKRKPEGGNPLEPLVVETCFFERFSFLDPELPYRKKMLRKCVQTVKEKDMKNFCGRSQLSARTSGLKLSVL